MSKINLCPLRTTGTGILSHLTDMIEETNFEKEWKEAGKDEEELPISDVDLAEAWKKAYPEPKDFLNFFVDKLRFYDTAEKDMLTEIHWNELKQQRIDEVNALNEKYRITIDRARTEVVNVKQFIGKEREMYHQLGADYRQKELEAEHWRRRYEAVCHLTKTKDKDVDHFMLKNPDAPALIDKMRDIREQMDKYSHLKLNKYLSMDPIALGKRIEALEERVPAAEAIARKRVEDLEEIYRVDKAKNDERYAIVHEAAKKLSEEYKEKQELLNKVLINNLEMHRHLRENERVWGSERGRLIKMIARAYNQHADPSLSPSGMLESTVNNVALLKDLKAKVKHLECSLLIKTNDVERLQMANLKMDRRLSDYALKELTQRDKVHGDSRKYAEKIKILEKRIVDDNNRRKLDGAGFREDVKHLKKTMDKLDRMLKYASVQLADRPELVRFRETDYRSKTVKRCESAPQQSHTKAIAEKHQIQKLKDKMSKEEIDLMDSRNAMLRRITTCFQRANMNIFDLCERIVKAGM